MIPERTHEQRLRALEVANEHRVANAALKRRLAEMPRGDALWAAAQIIRNPVDHEGAIRLESLLCSVQTIGVSKAAFLLRRSVVRPSAKLRTISAAQRGVLATKVEAKARVWQAEQVYA